MDNFLEWQMTSCKKRMRSTVVPHKNLYETMLSEPSTSKAVPSRTSKSPRIEITEIPQKQARFDEHASQQFASNVQAVHCDTKDAAVWAKPHYRSKGVQVASHQLQTTHQFCSPLRPQCKETSTAPLKMSQVISVRRNCQKRNLFLILIYQKTSRFHPSRPLRVSLYLFNHQVKNLETVKIMRHYHLKLL